MRGRLALLAAIAASRAVSTQADCCSSAPPGYRCNSYSVSNGPGPDGSYTCTGDVEITPNFGQFTGGSWIFCPSGAKGNCPGSLPCGSSVSCFTACSGNSAGNQIPLNGPACPYPPPPPPPPSPMPPLPTPLPTLPAGSLKNFTFYNGGGNSTAAPGFFFSGASAVPR